MQKATVAYSIYIFDHSPWKEMNDETTGPPNHPNLSLSKYVENIWKQKHSAVGSTIKTWSLKSWEQIFANMNKNTFNSNMWISLMRNLANNGNQPRNPHFHSPSTCSKKSPRSTMNDETPAPPNHPNHPNLSLSQDAGKVWESDIMTCRSIQRFCGAHPTHQALAPSAPMSLKNKPMLVTDEFVFSASAKAWKRRQIKAGVFIQGSTVQIVITEIRRTHDI